MLFKRLSEVDSLCVLRVSKKVLGIKGAVISDQNAASDYVRFLDPSQWRFLAFDDIYAIDWRHPGDPVAYWRHKARKCAEVLIPGAVEARFVEGAYVVDAGAAQRLSGYGFAATISVDRVLFFR
jgi:hypothetical protein